jgi:membrane protein DedA with SNARE-associated domain
MTLSWLQPFFWTFVLGVGTGVCVPEELLIVGAGIWAAQEEVVAEYGLFRFLMLPAAVVGVLVADCFLYFIGRRFGTRLLKYRWTASLLPMKKRQRIERNFKKYGVSILLFGRLLPAVRAPLFLTAGMMRVSMKRFLMADGLGAVLGNGLLFFLAVWFGHSFQEMVERVRSEANAVKPLLIMGGILLVGVYLVVHFVRRPVAVGDPEELPVVGPQVAARIEHHPLPTIEPLLRPEDRLARREQQPAQGAPAVGEGGAGS